MDSNGELAAQNDGVRRRVLVVDDERTIAEVVCRYLQRAGYETRQAFTGPDAVSVAGTWHPDLVVLDIMLPGFDGLETMRRLSGSGPDGGGCGPAVILLTARVEEPDRITGLRRGADDYVVKPFSRRSSSRASTPSCDAPPASRTTPNLPRSRSTTF